MKKIVGITLIVGLCGFAMAATKFNTVANVKISNVSTNSISTNEVNGKHYGFIHAVALDITDGSSVTPETSNIDIDIRTKADNGLGVSQTILSIDNWGGDKVYFVQAQAQTTAGLNFSTNATARIPLYGDVIEVLTSDADQTNINVEVFIIIGQ